MFKKTLFVVVLIAGIGVLIWGAWNRTNAINNTTGLGQGGYGRGGQRSWSPDQWTGASNDWGQGRGSHNTGEWVSFPLTTPGTLNADESAALLYMREEEKLAQDVYATLAAKWNLPIFQNISRSEQTHTTAVKALLDRYNLSDPASKETGVFTNPDLQALYKDLISQGNTSLTEALKVGAKIEEIDILDLEKRLAQTDNADIQQVFTNLKQGSYNHLRSFTSQLSRQTGETYQPQYLSAAAYQTILNSSAGTGRYGNGGGGGGGRGSRGNGQGGYRGGQP